MNARRIAESGTSYDSRDTDWAMVASAVTIRWELFLLLVAYKGRRASLADRSTVFSGQFYFRKKE
jgi:hypothetical protein